MRCFHDTALRLTGKHGARAGNTVRFVFRRAILPRTPGRSEYANIRRAGIRQVSNRRAANPRPGRLGTIPPQVSWARDRHMMDASHMPRKRSADRLTIFTVGHSTRPIAEFVELLRGHGVEQILDIRTIPKSRHNPQFNSDALAAALHAAGIRYAHLKDLGGLRHPRRDSTNLGWRNANFRGFADYMQTEEFTAGLGQAVRLAEERPSALMCAEAVPWKCHRSLVADALGVRGVRVLEIVSAAPPKEHALTPFARVSDARVTYPAPKAAARARNG